MLNYEETLNFIKVAHLGQVDKVGQEYWLHPYTVSKYVIDDNDKICALLHDVIEDTNYTENDLYNMGYNNEILQCLKFLTHLSTESYDDYIQKVALNQRSIRVKLADLRHNMDITRFGENYILTDKDKIRLKKYKKATNFLISSLENY